MARVAMARHWPKKLNFRIPFFRIFYSTTYTILFLICLVLLAITPATIILRCFQSSAYQYVFMFGGVYVLTALLAIFIYSSRLYTNRTILSGVGKAYIPIEKDELGRNVRKMIVKQLKRSATIALEARPRDVLGELRTAQENGLLPVGYGEYANALDTWTVGSLIVLDPQNPPWGNVQHVGWSSPTKTERNQNPHIRYSSVIQEMPNLIEARAVSVAPLIFDESTSQTIADPAVVGFMKRPENMALRSYLTQLSYLGLPQPPEIAQDFLRQYEKARFSPKPVSNEQFDDLMALFVQTLDGITSLDPAIVDEIRAQAGSSVETSSTASELYEIPSRASTVTSGSRSPVTARTRPSRNTTPYVVWGSASEDSFRSVVHRLPSTGPAMSYARRDSSLSSARSPSLISFDSDVGSVLHRSVQSEHG